MNAPFRDPLAHPDPDAAFFARVEAQYAAQADATMEAVIAHNAAMLIRQPWRAERIIPGASAMTRDEIAAVVNRILPHVTSMNRAIALKGLLRASRMPGFGPAWSQSIAEGAR